MTTAPRSAWPRRRTPWLRNRFGRGLLSPGALGLRLRRARAASPVVERWRERSTLTVRSGPRSSVALSVRVAVTDDRRNGRPVADPVRDVVRTSVIPHAGLAARNSSTPIGPVVTRAATSPARLDALVTSPVRHPIRVGRASPQGAVTQPMLMAAAPPRVLARSPRSEPPAPERRGPRGPSRAPASQPGPGPAAGPRTPDIERLTESVMAAIDRRMWSHRERMGRR